MISLRSSTFFGVAVSFVIIQVRGSPGCGCYDVGISQFTEHHANCSSWKDHNTYQVPGNKIHQTPFFAIHLLGDTWNI